MGHSRTSGTNILVIDDNFEERDKIRNSIKNTYNLHLNESKILNTKVRLFNYGSEFNIYEIDNNIIEEEKKFEKILDAIVNSKCEFDIILIDIHLNKQDEYYFNELEYDLQNILSLFQNYAEYKNNNKMPLSLKLIYWLKIQLPRLGKATQVLITSTFFDENKKLLFMALGADGLMERNYFDDANKTILHDYLLTYLYKKKQFSALLEEKKDNNFLELKEKLSEYNKNPKNKKQIIAEDIKTLQVFSQAFNAADSEANILILGENGVGKELLAKFIHYNSNRKDYPFIKVDCGSLPPGILESELFGHEKGAFTGAIRKRDGLFKNAHTGTLFLDEIGNLPLELQVKLLSAIQDKEIKPVGSDTKFSVDVRILTATNKNLKKEVDEGRFREDLYYRLSVIPLVLPKLCERKDDIIPLINHFISIYKDPTLQYFPKFDYSTLLALQAYKWEGNIRELSNLIERILTLNKSCNLITPELIPENIFEDRSFDIKFNLLNMIGQKKYTLEDFKIFCIEQTLKMNNGNINKTAKELDIGRDVIYRLLKKYNINIPNLNETK